MRGLEFLVPALLLSSCVTLIKSMVPLLSNERIGPNGL